eukprot:GHVP01022006.1.p2 GENE.GHVP01022006.1~~GHVP01022006.1.p2  ORF type:complete len:190 (+),score=48.39 GHVP01022006.1:16-585(+)
MRIKRPIADPIINQRKRQKPEIIFPNDGSLLYGDADAHLEVVDVTGTADSASEDDVEMKETTNSDEALDPSTSTAIIPYNNPLQQISNFKCPNLSRSISSEVRATVEALSKLHISDQRGKGTALIANQDGVIFGKHRYPPLPLSCDMKPPIIEEVHSSSDGEPEDIEADDEKSNTSEESQSGDQDMEST